MLKTTDAAQTDATPAQIAFVNELTEMVTQSPSFSSIEADLDREINDGSLIVSVTDDGLTTYCYVGTDGEIIGNWF